MSVARKLKRKNRQNHARLELLRHKEFFPARKMSEVILDFAEPLLDEGTEQLECFDAAIAFAIVCWNISFMTLKKQQKMLQKFLNEFPSYRSKLGKAVEDMAQILINRKKTFFAGERRMVAGYRIVEGKRGPRLLVASAWTSREVIADV